MNFKYIWAIIKTQKKLPKGSTFQVKNLVNTNYFFYPFQHKENIFTVDLSVWNSNQSDAIKTLDDINFWPDTVKIKNLVKEETSKDQLFLVLSNKAYAQTIDPNYDAPLVDISVIVEFQKDFSFLGYDVIDISGLSALTNIGYSRSEYLEINDADIEINGSGIISTLKYAVKFAAMANLFVSEHAPFSPVEVWGFNSRMIDDV